MVAPRAKPRAAPKSSLNKKTGAAAVNAPASVGTNPKVIAAQTKKAAPKKGELPECISAVHLEGEETDTVPVYDTGDVIRRKITTALQSKTGTTHNKAFLLRAFAACTSEPDKPIAATSFQRFVAHKGKTGGCSTRIFYAAYVYFEKERIAGKKKKTKFREEMEGVWGDEGMDWQHVEKPVWVMQGERPYYDQYGRLVIG
ncbi:hypothetical protein TWF694_009425 [Orbilia ellipsospora]|uniref:DUF7726 domain-containing protein n=1 Tax=Orbilia ellipsospora TaxID=2528407 RepID=A0AAV9XC41_9PEZI